jgi:hypothetical protein
LPARDSARAGRSTAIRRPGSIRLPARPRIACAHPSFRFEERLATRLAEAATAMRLPTAVGAEGRVVPFRAAAVLDPLAGDPTATDGAGGPNDPRELARPLLIGGALTSAAISIAGAALVAWRRGRPGRTPMARAARAARAARPERLARLD